MDFNKFAGAVLLAALPALAGAQTGAAASVKPADSPAAAKPLVRVTGIGGVFLKAKDPAMLRAWYKDHLGIDVQVWGGAKFKWVDATGKPMAGTTAWHIGNGKNFAPSTASMMVNYRVADLAGLLAALRAEGCDVMEKVEESEFGKFGAVMDPEGNRVELWQAPEGK